MREYYERRTNITLNQKTRDALDELAGVLGVRRGTCIRMVLEDQAETFSSIAKTLASIERMNAETRREMLSFARGKEEAVKGLKNAAKDQMSFLFESAEALNALAEEKASPASTVQSVQR